MSGESPSLPSLPSLPSGLGVKIPSAPAFSNDLTHGIDSSIGHAWSQITGNWQIGPKADTPAAPPPPPDMSQALNNTMGKELSQEQKSYASNVILGGGGLLDSQTPNVASRTLLGS